jgi:hypothetical protein
MMWDETTGKSAHPTGEVPASDADGNRTRNLRIDSPGL